MNERRRGRPRLFRRTVVMHIRVPEALYDALAVQALQRDTPVQKLAREIWANFCVRKTTSASISAHPQG